VEEFRPPRWAKPAPLGYGQAADAAHFVAAPLLASVSVAMIAVIGTSGSGFRWPGLALLALALAAMALVGSVQYGFHARALLYSAADLEAWWGSEDLVEHRKDVQDRQRDHFQQWKVKINRAVTAYNFGTGLLGAGVALCLAPPQGATGAEAACRWLACATVAAGALGELGWTLLAPRWQTSFPVFRRRKGA
jgi:hypothetical protein